MNARTATTVGAGLLVLALASFFLIRASDTGKRDFDRATDILSEVAWFESEMEGALLRLRSYLDEGFGYVTALQVAQRELLVELTAERPTYDRLLEVLQEESRLVDDFKAQHAVFRNSLYASQRLIEDVRSTDLVRGSGVHRELIGKVERAALRYSFLGSQEDLTAIHELTDQLRADAAFESIATTKDWQLLLAHIDRVTATRPLILEIDREHDALEVEQAIKNELAAAQARYAGSARTASYHLYALFGLALVLMTVVAAKIAEVRRHVAVIEAHRNQLENRVAERTAELAGANDQLKRDAIERQQMQEDLLQARKLESVGQLAAGVAHEINTPIQYVGDNVRFLQGAFADIGQCLTHIKQGAAARQSLSGSEIDELLLRADVEFLAEEAPKAIAQSLDGVNRVSEIVLAMKAFAHPSNTIEPADLNGAIRSSITVSRNEWKFVAEMATELDESLPRVPCAVGSINQVIVNMIVNAAHAIGDATAKSRNGEGTPTLGKITIRTRAVDGHAEIDIEDTGSGMSEETQARIFDPFFTTKPVGKGTGQGLTIAHRIIVEGHQGSIKVRSALGAGTCFTFRLPLVRSDAAAA